jgi:hypothetical protein
MKTKATTYPYAGSRAAKMLSDRLATAAAERWMSTRKLAKLLEIKQPSVISHLANGRLPIPVERAVPLAIALQMSAGAFLAAVLEQRFPTVDWSLLASASDAHPRSRELSWLEHLSGVKPEQLTPEQARIIGEVARDTHPVERWIQPAEVPYLRRLRERSRVDELGLTEQDWADHLTEADRHAQ